MDHPAREAIPQLTRRPAAHRSRVSNGSKLLPLSDGRSATVRRFRDLYQDICADLGGQDRLSEAQRQLARRARLLSAESERLEAMAARGEAGFDIEIYALQTGAVGLTLKSKDAARSEAIRRWPDHAALFARVKDDGRAESALIGIAGMG